MKKNKNNEKINSYLDDIGYYNRLNEEITFDKKVNIIIASVCSVFVAAPLVGLCFTGFAPLACLVCGIFVAPFSIFLGKSLSKIKKYSTKIKENQTKIDEINHKIELENNCQEQLNLKNEKQILPTELEEKPNFNYHSDELQL